MKKILFEIAIKHLVSRKRQSIVSLMGIVLGVAFFISISSLMKGSENDFIKRLVDNSPHITIKDQFRDSRVQPAVKLYPERTVEVLHVKPITENRGIRYYHKVLDYLRTIDGLQASPVMAGQAIVNYAGKDFAITLNGVIPSEFPTVSTINNYIVAGDATRLLSDTNGILIGSELARRLSIGVDSNITISTSTNQSKNFKVLAIFKTGRSSFDESQAYTEIKKVQAILSIADRVNTILIKLTNPYIARDVASDIEKRIGYQSVSWQETSEDLMNTLAIRNAIMLTVVSAVLVVAAFGIYNIISTIVMEKHRDIAILKSMGFYSTDVQIIFVLQGIIIGVIGSLLGILVGMAMMYGLGQIYFKPPGSSSFINMPIDWGVRQFLIASFFAMCASVFASYLPARKAANVHPVDILRGGAV